MYELIKAFKIRTSIVLNLDVPDSTNLPCFFLFFFMIDLYLLKLDLANVQHDLNT